MNLTAANGILICVLLMQYGIHANDAIAIGASLALAGTSYLTNVADELGMSDYGLRFVTMVLGLLAFVYVGVTLLAGYF